MWFLWYIFLFCFNFERFWFGDNTACRNMSQPTSFWWRPTIFCPSFLWEPWFRQLSAHLFYILIMVATAATSAFFAVASPSSDPDAKPSTKPGVGSAILRGIKSRNAPSGSLQVKANAQAPPKINGTTVGYTSSAEGVKIEDDMSSPPPRTFINQLPDWSMLLAAITTIFLAAEKQWMMLDWKPRRSDMLIDPFGLGKIVQDGLVFRQNFSIRSYEIGADRTASIETLMNHLQVWTINSSHLCGQKKENTPV